MNAFTPQELLSNLQKAITYDLEQAVGQRFRTIEDKIRSLEDQVLGALVELKKEQEALKTQTLFLHQSSTSHPERPLS